MTASARPEAQPTAHFTAHPEARPTAPASEHRKTFDCFGSQCTVIAADAAVGIPGVNIDAWTSGLASIQLNGSFSNPLVGYVNSMPWHRAEANISVVNSWTKTVGNHTIKWGVDYRRLRDDLLQTQTINPRGLFNFNTAQ